LRAGEIEYPNGRPPGVTAAEEEAGQILLCQARALTDLVLEARLIASVEDVEIKTLPCRIARLVLLAPDVMQVWLRLPAVEALRYQPGQYLDVLLDEGRRRSFSIANPPHDSELIELHVRRVQGGGFTERLFADAVDGSAEPVPTQVTPLREGALLRIEGPLGQFTYQPGSRPVVMVAGGTGFAPLKAMLRHVLEADASSSQKRAIHLYWGARQSQDLYEERLVLDWVDRHKHRLKFTAVLSDALDPGEAPHRRRGWVHEAVLTDYPDLSAHDVYAAGPPAMIEAIRATFCRRGLPTERLFFDSFDWAARTVGPDGPPAG
jgi:CDP-4-dehydro-6-deoxyglucose reductase